MNNDIIYSYVEQLQHLITSENRWQNSYTLLSQISSLPPEIQNKIWTYSSYGGENLLVTAVRYRPEAVPDILKAINNLKDEATKAEIFEDHSWDEEGLYFNALMYAADCATENSLVPDILEAINKLGDKKVRARILQAQSKEGVNVLWYAAKRQRYSTAVPKLLEAINQLEDKDAIANILGAKNKNGTSAFEALASSSPAHLLLVINLLNQLSNQQKKTLFASSSIHYSWFMGAYYQIEDIKKLEFHDQKQVLELLQKFSGGLTAELDEYRKTYIRRQIELLSQDNAIEKVIKSYLKSMQSNATDKQFAVLDALHEIKDSFKNIKTDDTTYTTALCRALNDKDSSLYKALNIKRYGFSFMSSEKETKSFQAVKAIADQTLIQLLNADATAAPKLKDDQYQRLSHQNITDNEKFENLKHQEENGWNLLMYGVVHRSWDELSTTIEFIQTLTKERQIEIWTATNNTGDNVLSLAAHHKPELISSILEAMDKESCLKNLTATNQNGLNALLISLGQNTKEDNSQNTVNLLEAISKIPKENQVKIWKTKNNIGYHALMLAANKSSEILKPIMSAIKELDKKDRFQIWNAQSASDGNNALIVATSSKPSNIPCMLKELLELSAQEQEIIWMTKNRKGNNALMVAAKEQPELLPSMIKAINESKMTNKDALLNSLKNIQLGEGVDINNKNTKIESLLNNIKELTLSEQKQTLDVLEKYHGTLPINLDTYRKNYLKDALKINQNSDNEIEQAIKTHLQSMWFNATKKQIAVLDALKEIKANKTDKNDIEITMSKALKDTNSALYRALNMKRSGSDSSKETTTLQKINSLVQNDYPYKTKDELEKSWLRCLKGQASNETFSENIKAMIYLSKEEQAAIWKFQSENGSNALMSAAHYYSPELFKKIIEAIDNFQISDKEKWEFYTTQDRFGYSLWQHLDLSTDTTDKLPQIFKAIDKLKIPDEEKFKFYSTQKAYIWQLTAGRNPQALPIVASAINNLDISKQKKWEFYTVPNPHQYNVWMLATMTNPETLYKMWDIINHFKISDDEKFKFYSNQDMDGYNILLLTAKYGPSVLHEVIEAINALNISDQEKLNLYTARNSLNQDIASIIKKSTNVSKKNDLLKKINTIINDLKKKIESAKSASTTTISATKTVDNAPVSETTGPSTTDLEHEQIEVPVPTQNEPTKQQVESQEHELHNKPNLYPNQSEFKSESKPEHESELTTPANEAKPISNNQNSKNLIDDSPIRKKSPKTIWLIDDSDRSTADTPLINLTEPTDDLIDFSEMAPITKSHLEPTPEPAPETNDAQSIVDEARLYEYGHVANFEDKKGELQAIKLYQKAVDLKHPDAMFYLAMMYESGKVPGIDPILAVTKAIELYSQAMKLKQIDAAARLLQLLKNQERAIWNKVIEDSLGDDAIQTYCQNELRKLEEKEKFLEALRSDAISPLKTLTEQENLVDLSPSAPQKVKPVVNDLEQEVIRPEPTKEDTGLNEPSAKNNSESAPYLSSEVKTPVDNKQSSSLYPSHELDELELQYGEHIKSSASLPHSKSSSEPATESTPKPAQTETPQAVPNASDRKNKKANLLDQLPDAPKHEPGEKSNDQQSYSTHRLFQLEQEKDSSQNTNQKKSGRTKNKPIDPIPNA